jgi:DNA-binding SARP family transcriptional activator
MEFRAFGNLGVRASDGSKLVLGGKKQRLVLATLLRRSDSFVSLAELVDIVWPHEPPPSAVATIRSYVSHLRRLTAETGDRIVIEPRGYVMTFRDTDWFDLPEFERLVDAGNGILEQAPDQARTLLRQALSIWRGDCFADLGDEPSLWALRVHLELRHLRANIDLAAADIALGDSRETVGRLQVLLRDRPHDEQLWALLISALHSSVGQVDALRAYQRAVHELAELGLEPSAHLRAAEYKVLAAESGRFTATPAPMNDPSKAFVGRCHELDVLFSAWDQVVARGQANMVLLIGEDGIGKTRLAREAGSRLPGSPVIHEARCIARGDRTFQPFDELFPVWSPHALDVRGKLLGRDNQEERLAIGWEHARQALLLWRQTCQAEPRVALLDEIHWMHDEAWPILITMAKSANDPVLIIATCRSTLTRRATEALSFIETKGRFHRIDLCGLGDEDIRALIEAWGVDSSPTFGQLLEASHGNPLLLEQSLSARQTRPPHLNDPKSSAVKIESELDSASRGLTEGLPS